MNQVKTVRYRSLNANEKELPHCCMFIDSDIPKSINH